MTEERFDDLTRQAADGISRRRSLLTLGGAGLAATLGAPVAAEAKKNSARKRARKKAKKKVRKTCRKQQGQCLSSVQAFCAHPFNPWDEADCRTSLSPCCQDFATCDAQAGTACLLTALAT